MKKQLTNSAILFLALLLTLSSLVLPLSADATDYTGACGDQALWVYDPGTRTLTISGTGPMWDYHQGTYQNATPWNSFKTEIEKIVIDYGITAIGRYAFCYMDALKELEFVTVDGKTTVEIIGGYSFCWNNTLEKVVLPEGVRFISGRAFSRVESIKEIWLPGTLESVDMYAFKSEDAAVTISKVYYNGTKADWAKVYVSTQGDNDKFLLPDKDTEWVYLKGSTEYSDVSERAWYKDAVYYLKDQGLLAEDTEFGIGETATMEWLLSLLYTHAGFSGSYDDAQDWATTGGLITAEVPADTAVTLGALCDLLCSITRHSGKPVDFGNGTALIWCKSRLYIPAQMSRLTEQDTLTRVQAASVLAAYFKSGIATVNRYDEMCAAFKAAYEAGGDGKMYIFALHHGGKGKVGDSTAILMPNGEVMLIDTFRSDGWITYLQTTLEKLGIKNLDYLVLSHGHSDHDSNLLNVITYIYNRKHTVGNYWSAGATTSTNEKNAIQYLELAGGVKIQKTLRAGDKLTIGSGDNLVSVDILWPHISGYNGDSNNGSLTMKLTFGQSSYLCGGDLFMDGEFDILHLYKDDPDALKADVMKTNHHGSYSSNSRDWVAAVDPVIMITHSDDTGDSAQCYEYSQDGRAWYSAGRDGGVLVTMDSEENITVTTGYDTNLRQHLVSNE